MVGIARTVGTLARNRFAAGMVAHVEAELFRKKKREAKAKNPPNPEKVAARLKLLEEADLLRPLQKGCKTVIRFKDGRPIAGRACGLTDSGFVLIEGSEIPFNPAVIERVHKLKPHRRRKKDEAQRA